MALETTWTEVACQRAVGGDEYAKGAQDWNFSVSAPSVWFPSKSYFRYEVALYGPGDVGSNVAPLVSHQVAFAENCIANSILNCYAYGGGSQISSVVNGFPQVAAVAMRTGRAAAWHKYNGNIYQQTGTFSQRVAAVSQTTLARPATPIGLTGFDPQTEEFYRPVATSGAATLALGASAIAVAAPGATDAAAIAATANAAANLAGNATRTLVGATTASGLATLFVATDVGARIFIGGQFYTLTGVATAGDGIQTLTVVGPPGPAVAATTDWYAVRRNLTRSDQARNHIQVMWQPPLGLFQVSQAMGSGAYKITLSPDPNYKFTMVETTDPAFDAVGAASRYTIRIVDVKLYIATGKLSLPDEIVNLDLMEFEAQAKTLQSSSQVMNFTVPQSTETLYIAFQDSKAGSNPRVPPNKFVSLNGSDLNLASLQVSYANQVKTATNWAAGFATENPATAGKLDLLRQFYHMSLQETDRDESSGGAESFSTWLDRGPLYAFRFTRDASARDTEVSVRLTFNNPDGGAFDTAMRLILISEHRRLVSVTHAQGQVTFVNSRNA